MFTYKYCSSNGKWKQDVQWNHVQLYNKQMEKQQFTAFG